MKVVFLIDGGPKVGLGHFRRSMRLLYAFKNKGASCHLLLPREALNYCISASAWPDNLAEVPYADIVVADCNRLSSDIVAKWPERVRLRLVIDDLANRVLPTDVVLNHNVFATSLDYSGWTARRLLLGLNWCLVDSSFVRARDLRRGVDPSSFLVSFGGEGGEYGEQTAKALLRVVPGCSVLLIVPTGAAEPSIPEDERLTVLRSPDMAQVMSRAMVYVGAAGVTALEAAAAGMTLITCALHADQRPSVKSFRASGIITFPSFDADAMAEAAKAALTNDLGNPLAFQIDGDGPNRVVNEVYRMISSERRI